jgi:hypothetical protein
MKTISATIDIAASPARVWAVLTDFESYPDWNPLFREATGTIEVGQRITLRSVHPASGRLMTVKPTIIAADRDRELAWLSRLPGLISGEHQFALTESDGGTRLVQSESFGGLLSRTASGTMAKTEAAFRDLNQAIKQRAEAE